MPDHNRKVLNDSSLYVAFQDEEEDDEGIEEGLSNSYRMHTAGSSTARNTVFRAPLLPTLSSNRNHQYRHVQNNDVDYDDSEPDEAPASLMVERPRTASGGIKAQQGWTRWFANLRSRFH